MNKQKRGKLPGPVNEYWDEVRIRNDVLGWLRNKNHMDKQAEFGNDHTIVSK